MIQLPDGSAINVDTADAASLREAARQFRQAEIETQNKHQWARRYSTAPPLPEPERPTLASLRRIDAAPPTAEELEARDAMVRKARAMAEIENALAAEAAAAEQTKADAAAQTASAFQQTAIGTLMRR